MRAEAVHFAKKSGKTIEAEEPAAATAKRTIEDAKDGAEEENEDAEVKRRRLILEEAAELDADSDGSSEEDEEDSYVLRAVGFLVHGLTSV